MTAQELKKLEVLLDALEREVHFMTIDILAAMCRADDRIPFIGTVDEDISNLEKSESCEITSESGERAQDCSQQQTRLEL